MTTTLFHKLFSPTRTIDRDPVQTCCQKPLSDCRCNDTICSRCEITKAEHEFIPQECLTLEAGSGGPTGFYPVTHASHLWPNTENNNAD